MDRQTFVHGERETIYENSDYNGNRKNNCKDKENNKRKKKRFSEEQKKCLEEIFEKEKKLEARRKMEVARQLRLEPKQVAIWFQNKRARSKSNQLQIDFASLRANYQRLTRDFQTAFDENQHLLSQLQKLRASSSEKHKSLDEIENRDYGNQTEDEPEWKAGSSEETMTIAENEELLLYPEGYSPALSDEWTKLLDSLDL